MLGYISDIYIFIFLACCILGKGGKNRRRGKNENENEKRELIFKDECQGFTFMNFNNILTF